MGEETQYTNNYLHNYIQAGSGLRTAAVVTVGGGIFIEEWLMTAACLRLCVRVCVRVCVCPSQDRTMHRVVPSEPCPELSCAESEQIALSDRCCKVCRGTKGRRGGGGGGVRQCAVIVAFVCLSVCAPG